MRATASYRSLWNLRSTPLAKRLICVPVLLACGLSSPTRAAAISPIAVVDTDEYNMTGSVSSFTVNASTGFVTSFKVRPPNGDADGSDDVEITVCTPNQGVSDAVTGAHEAQDSVTVTYDVPLRGPLCLNEITVGG